MYGERFLAAMLASWICFEALLRPGEADNLLVGDVCLPDPGLPSDEAVGLVLSIRTPKTRRVWRNQCVIVKNPALILWLVWWMEGKPKKEKLFRVARRDWAKLFATGLELLHVHDLEYTLGSLRGGGATHLFRVTENLALLQFARALGSSGNRQVVLARGLGPPGGLLCECGWKREVVRSALRVAVAQQSTPAVPESPFGSERCLSASLQLFAP